MPNAFLTNYTDTNFLTKIQENLHTCSSFDFSVSFIKKAGLVLLYKDIEAALQRGCQGRLITSTYQNFTDVASLIDFYNLAKKYQNFQCHLDYECFHDNRYDTIGYHSKGYFFTFDNHIEMIVGSSNITRYALKKNIEWNLVLDTAADDSVYKQAMLEFDDKWDKTLQLDTDLIKKYTSQVRFAIERWDMDFDISSEAIHPNYMQRQALKELNRFRQNGADKAMIIAAAGSGKTYLAAFDAYNYDAQRLLYIVHEETILRKALSTFRNVFGSHVTYGIYSGNSKDIDANFVFATNISVANTLDIFKKDEFDYIIIDECHHSTAESYRKIISYFKPGFMLGLTATPERMDNEDVFEVFQNNIPYELRLRDAIINGLVVPFHYYGIRDTLVNYDLSKKDERNITNIIADESMEHCEFIHTQIEKHRPTGKLKVLAFCRSKKHAATMSNAMSKYYHTTWLTGDDDVAKRARIYDALQDDQNDLEILFTIDIVNEGVDIPGVNMVLFLRPTDSSTIFIQQLGRGLRKYENKEYVTVLDFIGNSYKRSVQIAFALSSLSENFVIEKKLLKSLIHDDFSALDLEKYGVQIYIDDLSKEEIINYIDDENFNSMKYLKKDYQNFKDFIHCISYPKHMDYLNNEYAPDLIRFMNSKTKSKKNYSYYNFLRGIDEPNIPLFNKEQINFIDYLSTLLPLVHPYEFMVVQSILNGKTTLSEIKEGIQAEFTYYIEDDFKHAFKFMKGIHVEDQNLSLVVPIDEEYKEYLQDLLEYGLTRYNDEYSESDDFILYYNYQKRLAQLKLNKNPNDVMQGTYYVNNEVYIFASINKNLEDNDPLNYKDRFLQPDVFQWESKGNHTNTELKCLYNGNRAHLFIRKMDNEYGLVLPFTYVGTGKMENLRHMGNKKKTLMFDILMDNELPDYLQYDFGLPKQDKEKKN